MTFKFDVEKAIETCERGVVVAMFQRQLALFAVMCINEDGVSSHGGPIVSCIDGDATESTVRTAIDAAIAAAIDANEDVPEDHTCKYVPVPLGLEPYMLYGLTRQLFQLPLETTLAYEEREVKKADE